MSNKIFLDEHNCLLCDEINKKENIIQEYKYTVLLFNRYPYIPGHIMVVPKRGFPKLADYLPEERIEFIEVLTIGQELIFNALNIKSLNTGINTGSESGASIPSHLHIHIVPRTYNDMNFMNIVVNTPISIRNYNLFDIAREKIITTKELLL